MGWLNTNNVPLHAQIWTTRSLSSCGRSCCQMQLCNSVLSRRSCHFDPLCTTRPPTTPIIERFGSVNGKIYNKPRGSCLIQSKPATAIVVDAPGTHAELIVFFWRFLCWDMCKRISVEGFLIAVSTGNRVYDEPDTNVIYCQSCQGEQAFHESLKQ